MRKFEVGQKVRILRGNDKGRIARIVAGPVMFCTVSGRPYAKPEKGPRYEVDIESLKLPGTYAAYMATSLYPIDDGHDLISWEDMKDLWVPEGVEV